MEGFFYFCRKAKTKKSLDVSKTTASKKALLSPSHQLPSWQVYSP